MSENIVKPETVLDVMVLFNDKLELNNKEFDDAFDVEENENEIVLKQKNFMKDRKLWLQILDLVKSWGGKSGVQPRRFIIPKPQTSPPIEPKIITINEIMPPPQNEEKINQEKSKEVVLELSPFNINYNFKDQTHIDLLKEQISNGATLEIVLDEQGKIIDGGHSLIAYQQLGLDPLEHAKITKMGFDSDASKLAFSRHRNTARLEQEPVRYAESVVSELKFTLGVEDEKEVKQILTRYYNLKIHPKRYKTNENDNHNVMVIDHFFLKEPVKPESFISNYLPLIDFSSWLSEMVDSGKLDKSKALLVDKTDLPETVKKKVAEQCKTKSVQQVKEHLQALEFKPKVFTVWNFSTCDPLFGVPDFPGRIPGQIVQNILYYYTEEGDLVVDPMAGSGTTFDVCELMNRKCLCYDIEPIKEQIKKHDITEGFPKETEKCDLIFLDPPYFKKLQNKERYNKRKTIEGDLSSKEDFLRFMAKLAKDCYGIIRQGGIVALLVSDFIDDDESLLTSEYYLLFKQVGFKPINHFQAPLTTQQYSAPQVKRAQDRKELLNITRDLYIFRKVS